MSRVPLYPLPFEPWLRPMPWGGRRLEHWVDVPFPGGPIGEAWLLSDHPLHASDIALGPLAGVSLRQLMTERGEELVGRPADRFPLLIKLLDAEQNLSIQVHPDDADARRWAPAEGGKTEAWVVLEADPGSAIHLGLKAGVDKPMLARELAAGTLDRCLRRYEARPGECYFVPAGAIHALGGGLAVLEVQQTSDVTFRLYDWGRLDAHGRPRPLHVEAGLAVAREHTPTAGLQTPRPLAADGEELVRCDFFQIERLRANRPAELGAPAIVVGLHGKGVIRAGKAETPWRLGGAILVPASAGRFTLQGDADSTTAIVRF